MFVSKTADDVHIRKNRRGSQEILPLKDDRKSGYIPRFQRKPYTSTLYWKESLHEMATGSKTNILLFFVPLSLFGRIIGISSNTLFIATLLAMVPLAERLAFVTEQMTLHTTKVMGGIINATFGNITELMVCILALQEDLILMVQLSLLGSILSNLLLILGFSFVVGGLKHKRQKFNETAGHVNSGLLMLVALALLVPCILKATGEDINTEDDLRSSRLCSILLLINYCAYLYFQLRTHSDIFIDEKEAAEHNDDILGKAGSMMWLFLLTILLSLLSDILVDVLKEGSSSLGFSNVFICAVLVPLASNAAEHGAAIIFAYKDEMDIVMGISLGSSSQVASLILPLCVIIGWFMDKEMSLYFEGFETAMLLISVITVTFVLTAANGESNWLVGVILISCYIVICLGFNDHHDQLLDFKQAVKQ